MERHPPGDATRPTQTPEPTLPTSRFEVALVYAALAHARTCRKGTTIPYISHPLAVASSVLDHGGDEDEAISALLHDTVEDAGGQDRLDDIRAQFGARVADIVDSCSDAYGDVGAGVEKPPWKERKEQHLQRLGSAPPSVLLVTAADKLHNARAVLGDYKTMGEQLWSRFNASRDDSLWYYRSVADILSERFPSPLVDELERTVTELETLVRERS
jgi:(p)ppGpp synthase/HD superfamily hydrolase